VMLQHVLIRRSFGAPARLIIVDEFGKVETGIFAFYPASTR
jgi:hypothetical protein